MRYTEMDADQRWTWVSAISAADGLHPTIKGNPSNIFLLAEYALTQDLDPLPAILNLTDEDAARIFNTQQEPTTNNKTSEPATTNQPIRHEAENLEEAQGQLLQAAANRALTQEQFAEVINWASSGRTMEFEDLTLDQINRILQHWDRP